MQRVLGQIAPCGSLLVERAIFAALVDDEHVFGGPNLGLWSRSSVLRQRLGGTCLAALLPTDSDAVVGLLHNDGAIVGWHAANCGLHDFSRAFTNDYDQIGGLRVQGRS